METEMNSIFQLSLPIFFNEYIKFEKIEITLGLENLLILHSYAVYFSWILQENKIVLIFLEGNK